MVVQCRTLAPDGGDGAIGGPSGRFEPPHHILAAGFGSQIHFGQDGKAQARSGHLAQAVEAGPFVIAHQFRPQFRADRFRLAMVMMPSVQAEHLLAGEIGDRSACRDRARDDRAHRPDAAVRETAARYTGRDRERAGEPASCRARPPAIRRTDRRVCLRGYTAACRDVRGAGERWRRASDRGRASA